MRVFVTGASGFIGTAVVAELLGAGHQVVGLARSDASADKLAAAGAEVRRGDLTDLDALRAGAADADGVIHLAFVHDFDDFASSVQTDRLAIEALGEPLAGRGGAFVGTSGVLTLPHGRVATEDDVPDTALPRLSEAGSMALAEQGVRASVIRLAPTVHGRGDHGFVPHLIDIARQRGVSGHPGDGSQRWTGVHRLDAAVLYRLALESAPAGARLHGVADEGVPVREIAEVIGRHLQLPVTSVAPDDVAEHFGWIGEFWSWDAPASNALTRAQLGWTPTQIGLLADLDEGHYFAGQTSVLR